MWVRIPSAFYGGVTQLERETDFYSVGRGFEPCLPYFMNIHTIGPLSPEDVGFLLLLITLISYLVYLIVDWLHRRLPNRQRRSRVR